MTGIGSRNSSDADGVMVRGWPGPEIGRTAWNSAMTRVGEGKAVAPSHGTTASRTKPATAEEEISWAAAL